MNDPNHANLDERDVLIGRVAANEADGLDWRRFEAAAAADPRAWESLARALRDEMQMRRALDDALCSADSVEPSDQAFAAVPFLSINRSVAARWTGWAVAAALALAWVGTSAFTPDRPAAPLNIAGGGDVNAPDQQRRDQSPVIHAASARSPEDAFADYMRLGRAEGRVLEELPKVMIDTRLIERDGDGQTYEVFYVRQLLERTTVNQAFQINRDDLGRPRPVKVDFASFHETDM